MRNHLIDRAMSLAAAAALVSSLAGCGGPGEASQTAEAEPKGGDRSFFAELISSEPRSVTVPAGTVLTVRFEDHLSSHTSQVGQTFRTRVTQEVSVDGRVAIPAGSTVVGVVSEARGPKKVGGRARLGLDFDTLESPSGDTAPISAAFAASGKSQTPRDAAIIGGSTLGGAILGESIDEGEGTVVGAIVGGLAGTAAAIKTKGKPVEIGIGTVMSIELIAPVTVEIDR